MFNRLLSAFTLLCLSFSPCAEEGGMTAQQFWDSLNRQSGDIPLAEAGATNVSLLSIIGCPEGVAAVHDRYPDIDITLAALDERLNEHGYIVPSLGDAGDRIYGTK